MGAFNIYNSSDSVNIDILTDIGEGFFYSGFTMRDARAALEDAKGKNVTVNISSLGGDVNDALTIYDLFKTFPGKITANIMGATASAGTIIALGADHIRMSENSLFLVHNAWTGAIGNADDLRAVAEDLDKFDDRIINIYKKQTGRREATIRKLMKQEKWIDASEAFEWGFVDEVYQPMKAAASLNIEKIMASKKLPPLPENIINQKDEDMNLIEKLQEIKDLIVEKFTGTDVQDSILEQPEVADAMKAIEDEVKNQAEAYSTELTEKEAEIEALKQQVQESEAYKAKVDEITAALLTKEAEVDQLTSQIEALQAKQTPTPVENDPAPDGSVPKPIPSKFGSTADELKSYLQKYQTKKKE